MKKFRSAYLFIIAALVFVPGLAIANSGDFSGAVAIGSSFAGTTAPTNGLQVQGNVGIGTTTPSSMLTTYDSAAKTAAYTGVLHDVLDTSTTASVNKVGVDIESTGTWTGTSAVNTGLVVNATGGTTNYAATFSGGNVGIGTTSPSTALTVAGTITANGISTSSFVAPTLQIFTSGSGTYTTPTSPRSPLYLRVRMAAGGGGGVAQVALGARQVATAAIQLSEVRFSPATVVQAVQTTATAHYKLAARQLAATSTLPVVSGAAEIKVFRCPGVLVAAIRLVRTAL